MTKVQIGAFKDALNIYYVDMRSFPSTEDGLQALLEPPSDEKAARKWMGPYLEADVLPVDPWDNDYSYEYPPTNNTRDFPTSGRLALTVKRIRMTISSTGRQVVARPEMKKASAMKDPSIRDPVRAAAAVV